MCIFQFKDVKAENWVKLWCCKDHSHFRCGLPRIDVSLVWALVWGNHTCITRVWKDVILTEGSALRKTRQGPQQVWKWLGRWGGLWGGVVRVSRWAENEDSYWLAGESHGSKFLLEPTQGMRGLPHQMQGKMGRGKGVLETIRRQSSKGEPTLYENTWWYKVIQTS